MLFRSGRRRTKSRRRKAAPLGRRGPFSQLMAVTLDTCKAGSAFRNSAQRVCMKGSSEFWVAVGDEGKGLGEIVITRGSLGIGQ